MSSSEEEEDVLDAFDDVDDDEKDKDFKIDGKVSDESSEDEEEDVEESSPGQWSYFVAFRELTTICCSCNHFIVLSGVYSTKLCFSCFPILTFKLEWLLHMHKMQLLWNNLA